MKAKAGRFGNVIAVFGILLGPIAGTVRADVMYGITFGNQLITINTTTGAGTLVGNLDSSMAPYGLAVSNGKLYTYDQTAELIRQIDPATGHTLASINIGTPGLVGEGDLSFRSDGAGFLETANSGAGAGLLKFSLAPPSSSFLGNSAIIDGLDFDSANILYGMSQGVSDSGSKLYTVNQTNGALSLVGALNIGAASTEILGGLTFDSIGTLWGELSNGSSTSTLATINKNTGQATVVGNITGFGNVSGIAFLGPATVPEPSSVLLLGTCVIAIGLRWRHRVRSIRSRHSRV